MAKEFSFDIMAKVDMQEVTNAIDQAVKEIQTRFDFKGSKSKIELNTKENEINLLGDDDFKLQSVVEILESKMVKRNISPKALEYLKIDDASGGMKRQKIKIQAGIPQEKCKDIVKEIKNSKIKVQATIQGDLVRISSKDKDDLQQVVALIKDKDFGVFVQIGNYR